MTSSDTGRDESLSALAERLESCSACALGSTRTRLVYGVGDEGADLMFVGEAPGFHEDRQGEPFVGKAGALLTELLAEIGLRREDVYIANVLKCRPPENRDPLPDEIESCRPNLYEQIRIIRPKVICTLGRFATRLLAETDAGMGAVRGRAKEMEIAGVSLIVFPVFHPAAALYTPSNKDVLRADFKKLHRLLVAGRGALRGAQAEEPAVPLRAADPARPPAIGGELSAAPAPTSGGRTGPNDGDDRGPATDEQLPLW